VTGAVALAVVLVIAVVGLSLALQSQKTTQTPQSPRPPRPPRTPPTARRPRERRGTPTPPVPDIPPPEPKAADIPTPEPLRSGVSTEAKVISVVDERTIGPVTRSRLTIEIDPGDGPPFEVTTRVAFPTPEARARIKVGGTIPVRYDRDDHTRVVVDVPTD
jgi:hypothetical protein